MLTCIVSTLVQINFNYSNSVWDEAVSVKYGKNMCVIFLFN
jgi:hypothetical protein